MKAINGRTATYLSTLPERSEERRYATDYAQGFESGVYSGVSPLRQQQLRWEIDKRSVDKEVAHA